jgi:hypothetical protein
MYVDLRATTDYVRDEGRMDVIGHLFGLNTPSLLATNL